MSLMERIGSLSVERQQRILRYYQSLSVPATCDLLLVRRHLAPWLEKYTLFNGIDTNTTENHERIMYWQYSFISLMRVEITRFQHEPGFTCVKLSSTLDYLMTLRPEELFQTFKNCINTELEEYFQSMSDSIEVLALILSDGQGLLTTFLTRRENFRKSETDHIGYIQSRILAEQANDLAEVAKYDLVLDFSNIDVNTQREKYFQVEGQLDQIMSKFLEMTTNLITNFEITRNLFPPNNFQATGLKILNLDELSTRYDDLLGKILKFKQNLPPFQQFLDSFQENSEPPTYFVIQHKALVANQLENVQRIVDEMAKRSLIIETHPGHTIKQNASFSVTVKYLAPNSLNLNISNLELQPIIISDRMASNLIHTGTLNEATSCGEIEYEHEVCSARLWSQFKDMKIPLRPTDEQTPPRTVLRYKFHLLFYADVQFMNAPLTIWTMSIPFVYVLNTHSQLPLANRTIFWDVYLNEGHLPQGPERVTVERLTQAFNSYIQTETKSDNWNLTQVQTKYLVEKLLKRKNISNHEFVTRKYFETATDSNVRFWYFFYASVGLIKRHLNPFWKKGTIMGYLSREDAENMLANSNIGTFLVRFSDTSEGSISISWRGYRGPESVLPLTEQDLAIEKITNRIHDIRFFNQVICPSDNSTMSKSEAFPPSPPPVNSPPPQFGHSSGCRPYLKHVALWSILVDW